MFCYRSFSNKLFLYVIKATNWIYTGRGKDFSYFICLCQLFFSWASKIRTILYKPTFQSYWLIDQSNEIIEKITFQLNLSFICGLLFFIISTQQLECELIKGLGLIESASFPSVVGDENTRSDNGPLYTQLSAPLTAR